MKYSAYSPSKGDSKSKSSPTDAHEIDTYYGTRSQLFNPIRLWIERKAYQMKALAVSFTIDTHTCEIMGVLTEWRSLKVKIMAHRCTRNWHLRWHAEPALQPYSTLNRETSISKESPSLTLHDRHSHLWNIGRTHRVKGPQSQNHGPPMHTKLAPSKARGVISPNQFDSENRGKHIKRKP